MQPVISKKNITATWILPRLPYYLWGGEKGEDYYNYVTGRLKTGKYKKIIINSTDYIYPINTPHPRVHRYITNKELNTLDQYPYETFPIEIYHLEEE